MGFKSPAKIFLKILKRSYHGFTVCSSVKELKRFRIACVSESLIKSKLEILVRVKLWWFSVETQSSITLPSMSTISDEIEISDQRRTAEDSENSNHIDYIDSIDDTYDFKLGEKIQEKAEKWDEYQLICPSIT